MIIFIFASGCGSATVLPPTNIATRPPTLQWTSTIEFTSIQLSTPIQTPVPSQRPFPTATYTPTVVITATPSNPAILGLSTGGYPIEIYRYGNGPIPIVFIGGIHGGYEWNTILLSYELIDYFNVNSESIPSQITIYIIPSANPDGQVRVVGHSGRFSASEVKGDTFYGRFNINGVDLNRNWDCDWSPDAFWRDIKLDPGKQPFSEVETRLLRDFLLELKPAGVIFWHSAYPAVFPGECHDPYQPSRLLSKTYAISADYPALEAFTSYDVTGDSTNWLALQGIASIEVELTNHKETDFDKNLKGVLSILDFISNPSPTSVSSTQHVP